MISLLRRLFTKHLPTTHDYTNPRWGHDYTVREIINDGVQVRAMGWGSDIRKGDFLIIRNENFETTRYRVVTITYMRNPADMWSALLAFAPRKEKDLERSPHLLPQG